MPTPSARLLALLGLLQTRRQWSGAELATRLGVTPRTVRRDIERLRELGYAVLSATSTTGGYRLASGVGLPPLLIDEEEAVAIATGLVTASRGVAGTGEASARALAKLQQVLPERVRRRIAAVAEGTVAADQSGPSVDPGVLAAASMAARDSELVTFDYRDRRGARARRRVEPYRVVATWGLWYLVAYDLGRADWRTFRIDRIEDLLATGHRFTPRPLPDEDLPAYVVRGISRIEHTHHASVRVAMPREQVLPRLPRVLPQRIVADGPGHTVIDCASDHIPALLVAVVTAAQLDPQAQLRAEQPVREAAAELAGRLSEMLGPAD